MGVQTSCPSCWSFLARQPSPGTPTASSSRPSSSGAARQTCGGCGEHAEEFAQSTRGEPLCRACLRREDEALLEPIGPEERRGLDFLADILDTVSWNYWKPGEQPAELLDWLYLGDLNEALDFDLLSRKGIVAVVNLINWWELTARLPDIADLASHYASHGLEFLESDSEDRLFFDIVGKSWPEVEVFLAKCRDEGHKVLVNCKAGHNRSACACVCWLLLHEGMTLLQAVEWVLRRRGAILSNHGFRLQLVRLALSLGRLGEPNPDPARTSTAVHGPRNSAGGLEPEIGKVITRKRLSAKYDHNSKVYGKCSSGPVRMLLKKGLSLISEDVAEQLSQRTLKIELLACVYHRNQNFSSMYEYTSSPPTVIGSGFSGDVVLCRSSERTAVRQNRETGVRCVKRFDLQQMGPDRLEKLKNEAVIYLQLEHPHIARLFDFFEDDKEVSLVMQYCSGGTLEDALRSRGVYSEADFQQVAVQMLLAVNYIHGMGIVHRDIKPRNWVYEADGTTVKLIDFGFSVKAALSEGADRGNGILGCMGTLGYLAPEVVRAGLSVNSTYTEKCDIWSLGVVFFELLAGHPAFHREQGQCDGYTEEVVLREIEDVTEESVENILSSVEHRACEFLRKMLTKDAVARPAARQVLDDQYLRPGRDKESRASDDLSSATVLARFRAHSRCSKTSRAWLLAVARSPTHLPWKDFILLRNTFKRFDARQRCGTVSLDTLLEVLTADLASSPAGKRACAEEVPKLWAAICGKQESLSYCEFMAVLLPTIEDVFEDVSAENMPLASTGTGSSGLFDLGCSTPENSPKGRPRGNATLGLRWDPSEPVASFLPMLRARKHQSFIPTFADDATVREVVETMSAGHHRWVLVRHKDGRKDFFDYMDINHQLVKIASRKSEVMGGTLASEVMARIISMPVGSLANCSGHCPFVPMQMGTPLYAVLRKIASGRVEGSGGNGNTGRLVGAPVRRVPIVNDAGEVIHVFSCIDFLDIVLQFQGPSAVLKSQSARTFDQRSTILEVSVQFDDILLNALRVMDAASVTVCPATLRGLSGTLGGVVASNVVSAADLKLVMLENRYDVMDYSVREFVEWRQNLASNVEGMLRQQRLRRFNVVSVDAGDSLHTLAHRMLASKLQRIFLSSDEIARIVGIVSSRDILVGVLDQLL